MDLEQLTKHQIILLTLLVSFVTSIATGIVTVSLMDQAPPGVTRVVDQVVQQTVEKIVPQTEGAAVATQKTVVINQDDLAAQSIAAVQKSIIHVVAKGSDLMITRGVIIDASGTALTDASALAASGATSFEAILADGTRVPASVRAQTGTTSPLAVLDVAVGTSTGFAPASLADQSKLALGQSVIRIAGAGSDVVGEGVIASLPTADTPDLEASVSSQMPGSLLITLFGDVIGMTTGNSSQIGGDFYTVATAPPAPAETKSQTGT